MGCSLNFWLKSYLLGIEIWTLTFSGAEFGIVFCFHRCCFFLVFLLIVLGNSELFGGVRFLCRPADANQWWAGHGGVADDQHNPDNTIMNLQKELEIGY